MDPTFRLRVVGDLEKARSRFPHEMLVQRRTPHLSKCLLQASSLAGNLEVQLVRCAARAPVFFCVLSRGKAAAFPRALCPPSSILFSLRSRQVPLDEAEHFLHKSTLPASLRCDGARVQLWMPFEFLPE